MLFKTRKHRLVEKLKKWLRICFVSFIGMFFLASVIAFPFVKEIWNETIGMVELHRNYAISHSGWSFPGTIYSAPAPLDLPKRRRIAHAQIRGYEAKCPALTPGQYCVDDGAIIPRGGIFPEGIQPPGKEGWTRPLALEPIFLSNLFNP